MFIVSLCVLYLTRNCTKGFSTIQLSKQDLNTYNTILYASVDEEISQDSTQN